MSKDSRSGGKYNGNHTTFIPAAVLVADIANKCSYVTKISAGFITPGLKSISDHRRVKITDGEGSILLQVRDTASRQEIRVWATNVHEAKLAIAKGARNAGLGISFMNNPKPRQHGTRR